MTDRPVITLERDEAERTYTDLVVLHGNPRYFICKYLRQVDNDWLEEELEKMSKTAAGGEGGSTFSVFNEE